MAEFNTSSYSDNTGGNNRQKQLIWLAILGVVVLAVLGIFSFVMRYGRLEIQLNPVPNLSTEVEYEVLNTASKKTITKKSSDTFKQLLPKGNYEILVKAGQTSSFAVTKTRGFFGTTVVRMDLKTEHKRTFVGNNPQGCQFYLGNTLYSYTCDDSSDKLTTHVPAKSRQPTYVLQTSAGIVGTIVGSVQNDTRAFLLVKGVLTESSNSALYSLYIVQPGLKTASVRPLSRLDDDKNYSISTYQDGFLVYDDSFRSNFYYSFDFSQSRQVSIAKPSTSDQKPFLLTSNSYGLMAMYSDRADDTDLTNPDNFGKINTAIGVVAKSQTLNFNIEADYTNQISSAMLCGNLKLCILAGSKLTVYDIAGGQPKALYDVSNINYMTVDGTSLLMVRDKEVIDFKTDPASGFVSYSLGDYTYCGFQPITSTSYIACLTGSEGQNVALLINRSVKDSDSIDKKIQSLEEMSEISNVSINGNHIFITPNLSEQDYDSNSNSFSFNASAKANINKKINQRLDRLGIDRSKYVIINTQP